MDPPVGIHEQCLKEDSIVHLLMLIDLCEEEKVAEAKRKNHR